MDNIIVCKTTLKCDVNTAFKFFIENEKMKSWLALDVNIEPFKGGAYELFWDLDNKDINSTQGCKITEIISNQLLCFDWKGPQQFAKFMNHIDPLTHVTVMFYPLLDGCDVILVHTGYKSDPKWQQARLWFERVWDHAFVQLKTMVETTN